MTDTISKERVIENAQNIYDMFVSNYGVSSVLALDMKTVLDSLRAALTEALAAQPNHSEQHLDMVEGIVQVSADLIRQAEKELRQQCGGRCNAEYNPCWSLELADKLQCAVKKPNISEYPEKDISAQPVREPLSDEQIRNLSDLPECMYGDYLQSFPFARAIERAHGIGGDK